MNELKLEVFASDKPVQECSLHIYKLISANLVESSFKIIRGACRKLSNYNAAIGIFENGRQIISTSEIANIPKDLDFELEYQGCQQLDRDGFSNEDSEWYEHYFKVQGIKYSIIEVRKNVGAKVLVENDGDMNPPMGACIFNENKAYLVTTLMKNKKG